MTAHASDLNKILRHLRDHYDDSVMTTFYAFYESGSIITNAQREKLEKLQEKLIADHNVKIISNEGVYGPEGFPFLSLTHQGFDFIQSGGYKFYSSISNNQKRAERWIRIRFLYIILLGMLAIGLAYVAVQKILEIRELEKENELLKKELRRQE